MPSCIMSVTNESHDLASTELMIMLEKCSELCPFHVFVWEPLKEMFANGTAPCKDDKLIRFAKWV